MHYHLNPYNETTLTRDRARKVARRVENTLEILREEFDPTNIANRPGLEYILARIEGQLALFHRDITRAGPVQTPEPTEPEGFAPRMHNLTHAEMQEQQELQQRVMADLFPNSAPKLVEDTRGTDTSAQEE